MFMDGFSSKLNVDVDVVLHTKLLCTNIAVEQAHCKGLNQCLIESDSKII